MPTTAKLASAFALAVVAFLAAEAFRPLLEQAAKAIWFAPACAAIGAVCGWFVLGRAVGRRSYWAALGTGLRSGAVMLFWVLFVFASRQMLLKSLRKIYHGATEAVLDILPLMLAYGKLMLTPQVLGILVLGCLLAGVFAEWVARRWS